MEREEEGARVGVYHERQRLQFCLLHALNNLFQEKDAFSRGELNGIAEKLDMEDPNRQKRTPLSVIFRPHHNALTGNYDVNVLMAALEGEGVGPRKKKRVVWHDRRTGAASIDLAAHDLMGIMLNTTVKRLRGFWTGRHWLALRNICGVWYNLDSDLSSPHPFPDQPCLVSFLDDAIAQGGEMFLIFNAD